MTGIVTCLVIYGVLAAVSIRTKRKRRAVRPRLHRSLLLLAVCNSVALLLFTVSLRGQQITELVRNEAGQGQAVHEVKMSVDGVAEDETVALSVGERAYTAEEAERYIRDCKKRLKEHVLGDNKRADHITRNLKLVRQLPDNPTRIEWRQDRYDVMDGQGIIQVAAVEASGTPLKLTAHLSCGKEQEEVTFEVTVYPPALSGKQAYVEAVKALVAHADQAAPDAGKVPLPDEIDGRAITWHREGGRGGYLILLAGVLAVALSFEMQREKKKKAAAIRAQLMEEDYPRIVMTFSLLLRAGLTSRRTLAMIVADYERHRQQERPAYELLAAGLHRMEAGYSQEEVYAGLGVAGGSMQFERFGNLLAQNLRHGSGGIADRLAAEAARAFEERKRLARKKGEEAQIKLLLPMLLLFGIVLMAVMMPAFLSMQL